MSYLEPILSSTRRRVDELRSWARDDALEQRVASLPKARSFTGALGGQGTSIVAEIKRVSPAKGALDEDLNAADLASAYGAGGAAALSVVTEPEYFKGSLEDLRAAASAGLPLLRKDFILDELQVLESRAWGADAVLLIVRALDEELSALVAAVEALGMEALVEVHDEHELERAVAAGASLIGVNHRNLETFEVDPERTLKLAPLAPESCVLVTLSGVSDRAGVEALEAAGAQAVLIGESLVTANDPAAKLRELRGET
ncbi:indole-3-glycerol phosphate synthase TrpC [soil metagenome]